MQVGSVDGDPQLKQTPDEGMCITSRRTLLHISAGMRVSTFESLISCRMGRSRIDSSASGSQIMCAFAFADLVCLSCSLRVTTTMNDSLLKFRSLKTSRCGKGIEPYSLRLEILPVTKKSSVYLHECHVAEFLVVACEQDIFEWKYKAERRFETNLVQTTCPS